MSDAVEQFECECWDMLDDPRAVRRRYAVHLNRDTWEILSDLSRRTGLSMSSLVHFFVTERDPDTLAELVRSQRGRRRGRPRKSYHS